MLLRRKAKIQNDTLPTTVVDSLDKNNRAVLDKSKYTNLRHIAKKTKILIASGTLAVIGIVVLLALILSSNKTYKIGDQVFTSRDINNTKSSLLKSTDGKAPAGGKKMLQKESEDRVLMLAALKSEADKVKIPYDKEEIDRYLNDTVYAQNGGKSAYLKYLRDAYNWGEDEMYQYRTIEYLQSKLAKHLLQNRSYTVVYARWDNFRLLKNLNLEEATNQRQNDIKTRFLAPMKAGEPASKLEQLVDVTSSMSSDQIARVYASNISPSNLIIEKPGELKYDTNDKGENPRDKLLSLNKVGEVIGPFKSTDGRIIIARLEHIDKGSFANWEDFLSDAREKSGLKTITQEQQKSTKKRNPLATILEFVTKPFLTQRAYAVKVDCTSPQHKVVLTINLKDENGGLIPGDAVGSATGSASATRYFGDGDQNNTYGCEEAPYQAILCSVTGETDYKNVSCLLGWQNSPTTVRVLECNGSQYSINGPEIAGYTKLTSDTYYANGNGSAATVNLLYKKKAQTQTVTCTLSFTAGTTADNRTLGINTTGDTTGLSATITSTASTNSSPIGLPSGTIIVRPTANATSTYTATIKDSGGTEKAKCKASITMSSGTASCSIYLSGSTASYVEPYTASWTVNNAPSGYTLELYGSGSGNTANVSGYTSWGISPKKPTAANPSATTTYTLTVKSGGNSVASCSAIIVIGAGGSQCNVCGCPGYPACDYVTLYPYMSCEIDIWKADLTKSDKKGEKIALDSSVNNLPTFNAQPGVKYVVEPKERFTLLVIHTSGGQEVYEAVTPSDERLTTYMDNFVLKGSDELRGDVDMPFKGRVVEFDSTNVFKVAFKDGNNPGPFTAASPYEGDSGAYSSPNGQECFKVITPMQQCKVGIKNINVVFESYRPRFDLHTRFGSNKNLLKPELKPIKDLPALQAYYNYTEGRSIPYSHASVTEYGVNQYSGYTYPGKQDQTGDTYYSGKVLIWDYNNTEKLGANDVLVAVVLKDGAPLYKGVPLPSTNRAYGATPNPPPIIPDSLRNRTPERLPFPSYSMPSATNYLAKNLSDSYKAQLPKNYDVLSPTAIIGEHWYDVAIPVSEDNIASYSVKMYKVNLNGATSTDNFETRFDALVGDDGIPSITPLTDCGSNVVSEKPSNRPYLKVDGSDAYSGASFGPECVPSDKAKNASIQTNGYFAEKDTHGFSGSQYGAFASGIVNGVEPATFLGNNGYLRGGVKYRDLLFANDKSSGSLGEAGEYYGKVASGLPCINIDIAELEAQAATIGNPVLTASAKNLLENSILKKGTGPIIVNGNLTLDSVDNIESQKTLVVKGDLTINGNLTYKLQNVVSNLPQLKIIAHNIYITPSVNRLDPRLVAYPQNGIAGASPQDGVIDTCSVAGSPIWPSNYAISFCNRKLEVGGSLVARRIAWKGTFGSIGTSESVVEPACLYASRPEGGDSDCAAEFINFKPANYISRFINPITQTVGKPVSSVELPPIY